VALGRMHRFIRLQRATQIPARMLNVLVEDVGGGLDGSFLHKLVYARWLHERLGTAWDELATWWAPRIDARSNEEGTALYNRTFVAAAQGTPERVDFLPAGNSFTVLVGEDDLN